MASPQRIENDTLATNPHGFFSIVISPRSILDCRPYNPRHLTARPSPVGPTTAGRSNGVRNPPRRRRRIIPPDNSVFNLPIHPKSLILLPPSTVILRPHLFMTAAHRTFRVVQQELRVRRDRKSTRLNSSHLVISY